MGRFETLDSLMDQWERSVGWVEDDPESYDHEEFSDRLISRDSLEDALVLISPVSRQPLARGIEALDERFFAATDAVSTTVRPCSHWLPQRWWWFRVPQPIGKRFYDRLTEVAPAAARDVLGGR